MNLCKQTPHAQLLGTRPNKQHATADMIPLALWLFLEWRNSQPSHLNSALRPPNLKPNLL